MLISEHVGYGNDSVNEIRNMKPKYFSVLLEDITDEDIEFFESVRGTTSGALNKDFTGVERGYSHEGFTTRETTITNGIANNIRNFSTLRLKLYELAHTFASIEQWERFSIGDESRGEGPLSNLDLAYAYDTTVANVEEFKMLNSYLKTREAQKGTSYVKKMD